MGASTTRSIQENALHQAQISVRQCQQQMAIAGDTLEYTLGGTDADVRLALRARTGAEPYRQVPRWTMKIRNSYEVTVTVSDGVMVSATDSITVTISVTNDTSDDPTQLTVIPPTDNKFTRGGWHTSTTMVAFHSRKHTSGRNIGSASVCNG